MSFLIGSYVGVFTGGPLDGETMIVATQDGDLPLKLTFADYPNTNQVLIRPNDEFDARWAQYTYNRGVIGDGTVGYTFAS